MEIHNKKSIQNRDKPVLPWILVRDIALETTGEQP